MNTPSAAAFPSSPSKEKKKRGMLFKSVLVAGLALAGLIVFGLLSDRAEAAGKKAHAGAMVPYFQAMHEGKWKEAWERYTTADYKKEFPFETWEAAQKAHIPWKPASDIEPPTARETSNLVTGGVKIKYYFTLKGPDDNTPVLVYDVVETPDGPRINRSYRLVGRTFVNTSSGNGSGDTVDTPEPW